MSYSLILYALHAVLLFLLFLQIYTFFPKQQPPARKKSPPETGGDVFEGAVGLALEHLLVAAGRLSWPTPMPSRADAESSMPTSHRMQNPWNTTIAAPVWSTTPCVIGLGIASLRVSACRPSSCTTVSRPFPATSRCVSTCCPLSTCPPISCWMPGRRMTSQEQASTAMGGWRWSEISPIGQCRPFCFYPSVSVFLPLVVYRYPYLPPRVHNFVVHKVVNSGR